MARKRVVVLDDDELVRDLWGDALKKAGYDAVGIAVGSEALERLADLRPDLILLDMMMPEMDGFEFLARLRANPVGAAIPVLIISVLGDALVEGIDRRGAATLGVAGILPKPVEVSTVVEQVKRIIGPGELSARLA